MLYFNLNIDQTESINAMRYKNINFNLYQKILKLLTKPMRRMLMVSGLILSLLLVYKTFTAMMIRKYMNSNRSSLVTVSASPIAYQSWQPLIKVAGTLSAVQGVDVTTEVAGLIDKAYLKSGWVKAGDLLLSLNTAVDEHQLEVLKAGAALSQLTYERTKLQFEKQAVSQSLVDESLADLKAQQAQVAKQEALIAKKQIRAPFEGYLGINAINEGQFLNPGDSIATLQDWNTLRVNFFIPQNKITQVSVGKKIQLRVDAYANRIFEGMITAIDSKVDEKTRNLRVQATIENRNHELLPGLFVSTEIEIDQPKQYLTLPQSAIAYNPYGETVFVIQEQRDEKSQEPILVALQKFVKVLDQRGDQAAIEGGLQVGDRVVTSGQFKLKQGDHLLVNNAILPENNPSPHIVDE